MSVNWNNQSPLLKPFLISLASLALFYSVFFIAAKSSYSPLNENTGFKFKAISDGDKKGNSYSFLKQTNEGIEHTYGLGDKLEFPYCAMTINKGNGNLFSTKNKIISFGIKADTSLRVPVRLHIYAPPFTKKENDESYLFYETMVLVNKGMNHVSFSTRDMYIPSWWYTINRITEKDEPSYDLDSTANLALVSDHFLTKGRSRVVYYSNFKLSTDLYYYNVVALTLLIIILLIFTILWLLSLRKKTEVYIPILPQEVTQPVPKDYFALIQKSLSENYASPKFKAKEVAKEVGLSENKVGSILKERSGMTFSEYLNYVRLEEAKRLLLETDLPVSDIGYTVGFEYHQSFARVFKKNIGLSPSDFRTNKHLIINE